MKDELQLEALSIIKPVIKGSVERTGKVVKEMGSTLPGSAGNSHRRETPGFDLPSSKSRNKELTIDLREFTWGQREHSSSNRQSSNREDSSYVSEFNIREPSSRRIKDRIMNSQKTHK